MFVAKNISSTARNLIRHTQIRNKNQFTVPCRLEENKNADLESEKYKPKDHEGRVRVGVIDLPEHIVEAIRDGTAKKEIPTYIENGLKLSRYLYARHVPKEEKDIFMERKSIQNEILKEAGVKHISDLDDAESPAEAKRMLNVRISLTFNSRNYNWKPVEYDKSSAWAYLFGRADKEYASILKTFAEIEKRDPEFKPHSFFDFGAGVGTGTWAASKLWKNSILEYFLVDHSRDMNDLSEYILRGGSEERKMTLKNVFYRQFLPASDQVSDQHDSTLKVSKELMSAFSLMELPTLESRLEVLLKLWKKCDGYLVIIENGTNAGFQLIEEARQLITETKQTEDNDAYIFAPCPHEQPCPRVLKDDGTPCNFVVPYHPLRIGRTDNDFKFLYSYIIFKRGSRTNDKTINWPRVVRPTQVRSKHVRCKLCTHRGQLQEIILTKGKHSKYTYRCGKKSDWGDRLPIQFDENDSLESDIVEDDQNK